MRNGDLSNSVPMRFLVVFEGLVAVMDERNKPRARTLLRARQFKRAVRLFEPNPTAIGWLWNVVWKWDMKVAAVTFLPERTEGHIGDWLDYHNVPITGVRSTTPDRLASEIAYMPDVYQVLDPDPARGLTYGGRGRVWDGTEHPIRG